MKQFHTEQQIHIIQNCRVPFQTQRNTKCDKTDPQIDSFTNAIAQGTEKTVPNRRRANSKKESRCFQNLIVESRLNSYKRREAMPNRVREEREETVLEHGHRFRFEQMIFLDDQIQHNFPERPIIKRIDFLKSYEFCSIATGVAEFLPNAKVCFKILYTDTSFARLWDRTFECDPLPADAYCASI
jgi:hypothetical protein